VSDEVGDWIDKWASREGDGGFQDKAAEMSRGEVRTIKQVQEWLDLERKKAQLEGIDIAIQQLEMLRYSHEDE
jgi:hypothetical protein